jgi:hypothetical protein
MWKRYINEIIAELNMIQTLPTSGILAGGAVANKFWEKVSGNKAEVNDLDIFVFQSIKSVDDANLKEDVSNKFTKPVNNDISIKADHNGYCLYLNYCTITKSYYRVLDTDRNNYINTVMIESNEEDPNIIIGSFDLNCTQVGYDLATKKLYYTEEFNEFMETGIIEIVNINTPSHTLLRMLAKRDALNAKIDMRRELSYIKMLHKNGIRKNVRFNFSDKYIPVYKKYKTEIRSYGFYIEETKTPYNSSLPDTIYAIKPMSHEYMYGDELGIPYDTLNETKTPNSDDIPNINNLHCLNFFYKYVYGDNELMDIWGEIGTFWVMGNRYIEGYSIEELRDMKKMFASIKKWTEKFPMMQKSLFGMSLKEQIRSLSLLKMFIQDKDSSSVSDILSVSGNTMLFETLEDVEDYFSIMRIKNRNAIAHLETVRGLPQPMMSNEDLPF